MQQYRPSMILRSHRYLRSHYRRRHACDRKSPRNGGNRNSRIPERAALHLSHGGNRWNNTLTTVEKHWTDWDQTTTWLTIGRQRMTRKMNAMFATVDWEYHGIHDTIGSWEARLGITHGHHCSMLTTIAGSSIHSMNSINGLQHYLQALSHANWGVAPPPTPDF